MALLDGFAGWFCWEALLGGFLGVSWRSSGVFWVLLGVFWGSPGALLGLPKYSQVGTPRSAPI